MSDWISTRVTNLFRYKPTGEYVARRKVRGKTIRVHLGTTVFSVAQDRLHSALRSMGAKPECASTMRELALSAMDSISKDPSLKGASKNYLFQRMKALFVSWPGLAKLSPQSISREMVEGWAAEYSRKYSSSNYNNTLSVLKRLFSDAVRMGVLRESPADGIKRVTITPQEVRVPSPDQFAEILATIRSARGRFSNQAADLVELLALTGMRINSEAAHLLWRHVNFDGGTITITGKAGVGTKGNAIRVVPMGPELREFLLRLGPGRPDENVAPAKQCEHSLNRACDKIGIPRMRQHDLRHYFATRCIESGVDVPTVADWLGHKDKGVLMLQRYRHLRNEHSMQMAQRVRIGPVAP